MKHLARLGGAVIFWVYSFMGIAHGQVTEMDTTYGTHLNHVQTLIQSGQFSEAIVLLDELIDEYPEKADAHYVKSLLLAKGGVFTEALPLAEAAYHIEPKNLLYADHYLAILKETGNFEGALKVVTDLKNQFPDQQRFYTEKMVLLTALDRASEANTVYREATTNFGVSDTLDVLYADLLVGETQYEQAIELLEPYRQRQSTLPQVYSLLSNAYIGEKKAKKAVAVLEGGLQATKSSLLYLDLADAYLAEKKSNQAIEALKKALRAKDIDYPQKMRVASQVIESRTDIPHPQKQELVDILLYEYPNNADLHMMKGDLLWQEGNADEAHILYLRATEIYPHHIDAWRKAIAVRIEKNDLERAVSLGHEALIKNPNNAILHYFTGIAYMIKRDHQNARLHLETSLNNSDGQNDVVKSMIYSSLGDLYHAMDMVAVSDVAYEEAIALDSTNASALNNLAYYLSLRKTDLDKAEKYAAQAVSLDPSSGTFQDTYAWVLFQKGKYREAHEWIKKALKNSAPSPVIHEHYGDILIKLGKENEAARQWEKALELASGEKAVDQEKIKEKIREKRYIE